MQKTVRNIVALVLGVVVGSAVNMALIATGSALVPPPPGVDVTSSESIAAAIHEFELEHFIFPFLAHALGTFVGALIAFLLAATHKTRFAVAVGILFLCGGIANVYLIPAPAWFVVVDIMFAYLPMAWLAIQLGTKLQSGAVAERNVITP